MDTYPLAYTITDFCKASGLGRTTVYAEISAGRLTARKVGSRTLITREDGVAYLNALPAAERDGRAA